MVGTGALVIPSKRSNFVFTGKTPITAVGTSSLGKSARGFPVFRTKPFAALVWDSRTDAVCYPA